MNKDAVISISGLSKSYRLTQGRPRYGTLRDSLVDFVRRRGNGRPTTFWALKDVSFEVHRGEVLGVIGRNGAGKSTLLKILAKITHPTDGLITLSGRVGSLLEVGTGFHPELSGRDNVFLNGAILGMTHADIKRKFDEIVAFAEVEKFIDTPVKRYSSGMYLRLAFAVAAHLEADILLMDEVLTVGDAVFQKKCLGKMGSLSKQGRTVLFVSHFMNAVEELSDRVLLLCDGRTEGPSKDRRRLIQEYLNETTKPADSEWTNRHGEYSNPYFLPQRFALVRGTGELVSSACRNNEEIWIQIEGIVETKDPGLGVGFAVFNERQNCLFWSFYTDRAEVEWLRLEPGTNVLRCRLPSRLLNEGTYRIELIAGLYARSWLLEPGVNAPDVVLKIQGGLSDSPYFFEARPTLLAPILKWELASVTNGPC